MEQTYTRLAQRIVDKLNEKKSRDSNARLLIALAGPPGSGKTTVAQRVVQLVNSLPSPHPKGLAISADGFHLSLATLRALPNAEEAIARRGAPWTFDGAAAVSFIRELAEAAGTRDILVPTFDHSVKDPVVGGMIVESDVDVCIFEGNYVLVDQPPWLDIGQLVDDRWLVNVQPERARLRVAERHLKAGIEHTTEAALMRAENNDLVNGAFVVEHSKGRYDILIESVEEHLN